MAHYLDSDEDGSQAVTGPRDLRTSGGGGTIYPVDPAAVARFKEIVAKQAAEKRPSPTVTRRETGIKRTSSGLDSDLAKKVAATKARMEAKKAAAAAAESEAATEPEPVKKNEEIMSEKPIKTGLSDEQIRVLHGRYLAGESMRKLAAEAGISWQRLSGIFQQEGLPGRPYLTKQGHVGRNRGPKKNQKPAVKKQETAVVPVQETAVATNGHTPPGDLREQLGMVQELLSLATAKNIRLSGKIHIELSAEVEF